MTFNAHIIVDIHTFVFVFIFEFVCESAFVVTMITIMMTIVLIVGMDMACRHIPTMTKCHHGGEMSVMIKVHRWECVSVKFPPYMINFNFNSWHW